MVVSFKARTERRN